MQYINMIAKGTITSATGLVVSMPHLAPGANEMYPAPRLLQGQEERLFFPAASIRGKLRRAACDVAWEALCAREGKKILLDLETYQTLRIGGIKKNEKEEGINYPLVEQLREANPIISLFGASTPAFIAGRLHVGHAIAQHPIDSRHCFRVSGYRTDDMRRDPEQAVSVLNAEAIQDYAAKKSATKEKSKIKKESAKLTKEINDLKKQRNPDNRDLIAEKMNQVDQLGQDQKNIKDVSIQQQVFFEAIPPELPLVHNMRLVRASLAETGLFVKALERFALVPLVGGHLNTGMGEVSAEWNLIFKDSGKHAGTAHLSLVPFEGISIDDPDGIISRCVEAWETFSQSQSLSLAIKAA